ncbi:MAG: putative metal-binding motif-containing protein, partial [Myxococcota bacterium]
MRFLPIVCMGALFACDPTTSDIPDDPCEATTTWADADGDGFGDADAPVEACEAPAGHVTNARDCDDADPDVHPDQPERCDGIDNDCSGAADDGLSFDDYYVDGDGDGYGAGTPVSSCAPVPDHVTEGGDCDDVDNDVHPGGVEICDAIDNDCSGAADDGLTFDDYFVDDDGDGFGTGLAVSSCAAVPGFVTQDGDCDDAEADVNPAATEVCDAVDNDCVGGIDDGLVFVDYYVDRDGDGYGTGPGVSACATIAGSATQDGDCDDNAAAVNPGAVEICDEIDNDCANGIDEGLKTAYYADGDGDGYGTGAPELSCDPVVGRVTGDGDCDDADDAIHPGATEACDGVDNDCANGVDDGLVFTDYFVDADGDGFGTGSAVASCQVLADHSTQAGDCDDADVDVHPNGIEVCNTIDDDCDTAVDEGVQTAFYEDNDGDGWGGVEHLACSLDTIGWIRIGGDCDDTDDTIHPRADDVCDGIDQDCGGEVEHQVPSAYPTIRSAIVAASAGDWVCIDDGRYEENLIVDRNVRIVGTGSDHVVIDGQGAGRAVEFTSTALDNALVGVRVEDGLATVGAGIRITSTSATSHFEDVVVDANQCTSGNCY